MLPRCWRLSEQRYRLQGVQCPICGKVSLLGRPVCCERGAASANDLNGPGYALPIPAEVYSLQANACLVPVAAIQAEVQTQLGKL
jgi:hypothetical protein